MVLVNSSDPFLSTAGYDQFGRRISLASTIGGTADFKNDYTYDPASRLTRVTQQDVNEKGVRTILWFS